MPTASDRSSARSRTEEGERWQAVLARDLASDGRFFFAVKTTGIYCRPSCAARRPRRENVVFYATSEDARRAGFRACKRCEPDGAAVRERNAARIAIVCRSIEAAQEMPSLEELAREVGLSNYHFHRLFKSVTGVTPRIYALAHRDKRLRSELGHGERTVTAAIYDAGFNSSGTFYNSAGETLGMTPSDYRAGGANVEIRFAIGECSFGSVLVAKSERGVCAILLGDDPGELARELQDRFPSAEIIGGDPAFEEMIADVIGFVEAPALGLDLPLDVRGTAFQQRVWQALREIPAGSTVSYAEVARRIGSPRAVRAVARACAANTLAVAIPCHRVVRTDGALSGYRWGVQRKSALLTRESVR